MNKKVLKVGNLSTGNSQAGTIYRTWGGFPLHCAPELTDMHLVIWLLIKRKPVRNK